MRHIHFAFSSEAYTVVRLGQVTGKGYGVQIATVSNQMYLASPNGVRQSIMRVFSMENDPRSRNLLCDRSSIGAYLQDYGRRIAGALAGVNADALERACALIETTAANGNHILSIGNGGSAAIADHLCCDLGKGTHHHNHPAINAQSLVANMPMYSAIANDFGFERVFEAQIDMIGRSGDVLIAISSSGNSPNILNAVEAARARGMTTIGLSGFDGGRLRESAEVSLHVDDHNYGIVEDAHQAIMHVLAQYIACKRDGVS